MTDSVDCLTDCITLARLPYLCLGPDTFPKHRQRRDLFDIRARYGDTCAAVSRKYRTSRVVWMIKNGPGTLTHETPIETRCEVNNADISVIIANTSRGLLDGSRRHDGSGQGVRLLTDRIGSGQEVFEISRVGSGHTGPARATRHQ